MSGHWLIVLSNGHRVRSDCCAPAGLKSKNEGRLELGPRVIVVGGIRIQGSLLTARSVRINGHVKAAGRTVIGPASILKGNLRSGADLHLLPGTQVDGWVESGADLHIHEGVTVRGALKAGGDLIVHGPATTGPVTCGGRVATLTGRPRKEAEHPPEEAPVSENQAQRWRQYSTPETRGQPALNKRKQPAIQREAVPQNLLQ